MRDSFVTSSLALVVKGGLAPLLIAVLLVHLPGFDVLHLANAGGVREPKLLLEIVLFAVTPSGLCFLEGRVIPAASHPFLRGIVLRLLCVPRVVVLRFAIVIKVFVPVAGRVVVPGVAEASFHGDGPENETKTVIPVSKARRMGKVRRQSGLTTK